MMIAWIVLFFLAGIAVGSFLNVVADRLPAGQSIISPPSHCPNCQRRIVFKDLVPVFSYILLKGRCRYCGSAIPVRSLIVELGTGFLFAFLYWHYGLSWELAIVIVYSCLFIVLIVTDLEHGVLPNKIVYPGMIIALVFAGLGTIPGFEPSFIANSILRFSELWIVNAAIGGGVGFVILFIIAIIFRGGMGWGDVKLAGLMGLAAGFPLILVAIFLAVVTGGLVAIILLLLKVKRRKDAIPFGPFLAVAAMATLFWGNDLLHWYLNTSIFSIAG
jgi:leader peptidase (prepilin peptidase)/N-methyltransferase